MRFLHFFKYGFGLSVLFATVGCSVSILTPPIDSTFSNLSRGSTKQPGVTSQFFNYQAASLVIGQADFKSTDANQGGAGGLNTMGTMWGPVLIAQNKLYVADADTDNGNARILVFDPVPSAMVKRSNLAATAYFVLDPAGGAQIGDFSRSYSITLSDDGKFIVADMENGRVLIWNQIPSISGADVNGEVKIIPDMVIGVTTSFDGNPLPPYVGVDTSTDCKYYLTDLRLAKTFGTKLIVSSHQQSRVSIWNSMPTETSRGCYKVNGVVYCTSDSADMYIGKPDCSNSAADVNGHLSLHELAGPRDFWTDGVTFLISDTNNNRVLFWNKFPVTSDIPNYDATDYLKKFVVKDADYWIGDPDGGGGTDYNLLDNPYGVTSNGTQLFLAESGHNCRVMIWNQLPTQSNVKADIVLGIPPLPSGQPDFKTAGCPQSPLPNLPVSNRTFSVAGGVGDSGLQGVYYANHQLWVSNYNANRLMMFQGYSDANQCGQPDGAVFSIENAPGGSGQTVSTITSNAGQATKLYPTLRDSKGVFLSNPISHWAIDDDVTLEKEQNQYDLSSILPGVYQLRAFDVAASCMMGSVNVVIPGCLGGIHVAGHGTPAGFANGAALYWKNGVMKPLTDGSLDSYAVGMTVVGSDVYVVGKEGDVAKYWRNGYPYALTDGTHSAEVRGIVASGADIYIAGNDGNFVKVWKNGNLIYTLTDGTKDVAVRYGLAVQGSDVYVGGHVGDKATVWKNGSVILETDGTNSAEIEGIAVSGANVYVSGWEDSVNGHVSKYWLNGVMNIISGGLYGSEPYGNALINGTDFYFAGFEGDGNHDVAKVWKNGAATPLTDGTFDAQAHFVSLHAGDVYVVGEESDGTDSVVKYWKNGINPTPISSSATLSGAMGHSIAACDP